MSQSAIAYIVFNRPALTKRTFASIREQRPKELFVIADGPRQDHPSDFEQCAAVRKILEDIDWPCKVHRNYAEQNLGCKRRVSSGLDWVFAQVEEAIILEDDCLPHPDFFAFCNALLTRYADDERVSLITGDSWQEGQRRGNASYYFSKYPHIWGWATWRRAWKHYQENIPFWPEWKESDDWQRKTFDEAERRFRAATFEMAHSGTIDAWGYSWVACVWYHGGLTATPYVNLVSNIGFGPNATHTRVSDELLANRPTRPLGELTHPTTVEQNFEADRYVSLAVDGSRYYRFPRNLLYGPLRAGGRLFHWLMRRIAK